jgi:transposase-like protein
MREEICQNYQKNLDISAPQLYKWRKDMRNRNRWWMVDNVKTNPSLKVMYHIRHDVQISHDRNEKI